MRAFGEVQALSQPSCPFNLHFTDESRTWRHQWNDISKVKGLVGGRARMQDWWVCSHPLNPVPPFLKPWPTWDFTVAATDCGDQWQDDCESTSEPVSPNPFTIGLERPHGNCWAEGPMRSLAPSPWQHANSTSSFPVPSMATWDLHSAYLLTWARKVIPILTGKKPEGQKKWHGCLSAGPGRS